jgi:hypothetical protein
LALLVKNPSKNLAEIDQSIHLVYLSLLSNFGAEDGQDERRYAFRSSCVEGVPLFLK